MKIIISGIAIVFIIAMASGMISFFVPLNAKFEMNTLCREALIKMEAKGSLSSQDKQELIDELTKKGFSNITVTTANATKQGDEIKLNVQATYQYKRMIDIFTRSTSAQLMIYDKTSVCRKVVN